MSNDPSPWGRQEPARPAPRRPGVRLVVWLGVLTLLRVMAMSVIATLIWTPIGVWIGLRPRVARIAQPLAQIAASFPVNMTFPFIVALRLHADLASVFEAFEHRLQRSREQELYEAIVQVGWQQTSMAPRTVTLVTLITETGGL